MGIEPTPSAWKAEALPICNVRVFYSHTLTHYALEFSYG